MYIRLTMIITVIARRHKYIRIFKELEATSYDNSVSLEEYGIRKSLIFHRLVKNGIIRQTFSGRFYLDAEKEKIQTKRRQDIILLLLLAVISAVIISAIVLDYFTDGKVLMIEKW